jgi:3',5'-cyclic AMP phosphodiesterase CpdA
VPAPRAATFTFVHASDTHVSPASLDRMRLLGGVIEAEKPDFVLISGDPVRDALRVGEAEATGYYEMFVRETQRFPAPVWTVPGNHEMFGIEREQSNVGASHPLYGRAMYRQFLGPDYYSFTHGGIHFIGLNTIDIDDQWYYGHVDAAQLSWLARDLSFVPANVPVVTFNHIPFVTTGEAWRGYTEEPPAPSLITVAGRRIYRHVVSNAGEVFAVLKGRPYPLAFGGHLHMREVIQYEAEGLNTRFHQAAAVVGPNNGGAIHMKSGVTV